MTMKNRWYINENGEQVAITVVDGITTWTEEAADQIIRLAGFTETENNK